MVTTKCKKFSRIACAVYPCTPPRDPLIFLTLRKLLISELETRASVDGSKKSRGWALSKGSRKNNLADFALRFGLDLVDPIKQNHGNSKLFREFCE